MPVTLRAALVVAMAAAVGCSGSGPGGTGTSDAGAEDGGHCFVRDAGCAAQSDCGESRDAVHVYTCESGRCARQAGFNAGCIAKTVLPQVQISLKDWGTNKPGSFEIRAYYPKRVDGSAVTCADIAGSADFPDGGSPLDVDATLNIQNVTSTQATCTSGQTCTYLANLTLVPQTAPVILVQAYTGGRDITGTHATGIQLGDGCTEGTEITEGSGAPQSLPVAVSPR